MEDKVLAAATKWAGQAEVYSEREDITTVQFQANRVHAIEHSEVSGVGLRVIENGRVGFASSTNPEQVNELVKAAVETADYGEPVEFSLPARQDFPRPEIFSSAVALEPVEDLVGLGDEVIDACLGLIPEIQIEMSITKHSSVVRVLNSRGLDATYEKMVCALGFEGLLILDSSFIWLNEFADLSARCALDVNQFAQRLALRANQARRQAKLETKNYPCLFVHMAPRDVLQAILPAVNGKSLERGISPLMGKENHPVLSPKFTIWDDGLNAFGYGTAPFDGDGMPQQKTLIIENGILRNFLFDLKTATALKRSSTGNAQRSFRNQPYPGMTNFVVAPGELNLEKTIAGIKEGIIIYSTVGAGQSNLLAGDFSMSISLGYKIENGEITGRVKDAMVAGNIYDVGKSVIGLGDTPFSTGRTSLPFVFFPALCVATRG